MSTLLDTASLIVTPNGYKAGKLYSVVPSSGAGDLDVTRATTATRVNSSGLIESVASNVPRLDYTNGSCPSILVEPQRTNIVTYSNDFSNAAWLKITTTVTPNYAVSPDGNTNASRVQFTSPTSQLYQLIGLQSLSVSSFYVKGTTGQTIAIYNSFNGGGLYELRTLTGQWQRIEVVSVGSITSYSAISNFLGATATDVLVYGAQFEVGSYPTSYIATTSASVTRNADVISKTGISSLIGQTEGTVFYDIKLNSRVSYNYIFLGSGSTYIGVYIDGSIIGLEIVNGTLQTAINYSNTSTGQFKIGIAYKNNDIAFYVNGILVGTDNTCNVPAVSAIDLTFNPTNSISYNAVSLWKTRLTNTQLAQLTTI